MLALDLSTFPELRTERLRMRELLPSDANDLFALRSDPRVMEHIGRPSARTLADAEELIALIARERSAGNGLTWAITLADNDRLIGTIGYYRLKLEHHRGEIGYMLSAGHWGRGLMSEALEAAVRHGFDGLHFHSIEALTDPVNVRSRRLLEKHCFRLEGHLCESYRWEGTFGGTTLYARLATEPYPAEPYPTISFETMPWREVSPGMGEKCIERNGRRMRLVRLEADHEPARWCRSEHMGMVVQGRALVRYQGSTLTVEEGQGLWIPAGAAHKVLAAHPDGTVVFLVGSA